MPDVRLLTPEQVADEMEWAVAFRGEASIRVSTERHSSLLLAAELLPQMAQALEDALGSPDPNERFEALAERFYRETGIMAPGKDVPAASGDDMPYDERRKRWSEWQTARIDGFRATLARYRAALGTAEDGASSAREASAAPQGQGATPDPQDREAT